VELPSGAYDSLVTQMLAGALDQSELIPAFESLDTSEASARFGQLISDVLERAIESLPESERVERGAVLTNELIERVLDALPKGVVPQDVVDLAPRVLSELGRALPTGEAQSFDHPETPLRATSLLTNASKEPSLLH